MRYFIITYHIPGEAKTQEAFVTSELHESPSKFFTEFQEEIKMSDSQVLFSDNIEFEANESKEISEQTFNEVTDALKGVVPVLTEEELYEMKRKKDGSPLRLKHRPKYVTEIERFRHELAELSNDRDKKLADVSAILGAISESIGIKADEIQKEYYQKDN